MDSREEMEQGTGRFGTTPVDRRSFLMFGGRAAAAGAVLVAAGCGDSVVEPEVRGPGWIPPRAGATTVVPWTSSPSANRAALQSAIDNAAAYDTIVLSNQAELEVDDTIWVSKPLHIEGQFANWHIRLTNPSPSGGALFQVTSTGVSFAWVGMRGPGGSAPSANGINVNHPCSINYCTVANFLIGTLIANDAHGTSISSCSILSNFDAGVQISANVSSVSVSSCGVGGNLRNGIDVNGNSCSVTGNSCYSNGFHPSPNDDGCGILVWAASGGGASGNVVSGNSCYGNSRWGIAIKAGGSSGQTVSATSVSGNTVQGNGSGHGGILVEGLGAVNTGTSVSQNTVSSETTAFLSQGPNGASCTVTNNNFCGQSSYFATWVTESNNYPGCTDPGSVGAN